MGRVPGAAAAAANPTTEPGILARAAGVLTHPRSTCAHLPAQAWAGVLALSTTAAAVVSALFYSTAVGRLALVDQWERTAFALGVEVDDARYAELVELSRYGGIYGAAHAVVGVAGVSLVVAAAVFTLLRARDSGPTFRQVLAVTAHASVILALRAMVAAAVGYARERTSGAISLADWLSIAEQGSPAAWILGTIDLMVIWWAIVAALGIAELYGRPARRLVPLFVGVYVGLALIFVGARAALSPA